MKPLSYSIISAARNEELYIRKTLESVTKQTIHPKEWIIINDGSDDDTANIISQFSESHPWITILNMHDYRPDIRTTGGRVGHILNIAWKKLKYEVDLIVKLDADTEFGPSFFELILKEFNKNNSLGIGSGHLFFQGVPEKINLSTTTRGAVMMIRSEIFRQTGGFFESSTRGEDRLFAVAARFYGWQTRSFPIRFNHLKPEGERHSKTHESYLTGFYKGSIPYRADYFLLTQLKHIFRKPYVLGTVLQIVGYIDARLISKNRPFPPLVKTQLHKEQNLWASYITRRQRKS